ncbi:hypothetical protein [Microbacterium sp. 69-10]|uniref:hypothetical protein n=1 Tax=Microbacterium sp. 69-10 TaxID=1895783 RepID=UPI0025DEE699|nr:hypothetical protein [Microbacterium sp. 69-10]
MPLAEYIDEAMRLLEDEPEEGEILVERVKFLRYGEVRGDQKQVIATLNGDHAAEAA